jgi:hypothetical protein
MADTQKVVKAEVVNTPTPAPAPQNNNRTWWIIGGALAVVAMICGMAWGMAHRTAFVDGRFDGPMMQSNFSDSRFDRDGMRGGGGMMGDRDAISSDSTRVSGVVTAINGSTLTVAGNGTTKQVTTNDSTTYYGAAQPVKVNDSIMITGTTSGDTFTAGRIVIQRQ